MQNKNFFHRIFWGMALGAISFVAFFYVGRGIASIAITSGQTIVRADTEQQEKRIKKILLPPEIAELKPGDKERDVLLDMESPIRVVFEKSVRDYFIRFDLVPEGGSETSVDLAFENNEEKTEFRLLPKTEIQENTTYTLSISYKKRGEDDNAYVLISKTSFVTLPPEPSEWGTGEERLLNAKKFTRPKKTEGRYIDINLDTQVMTLFEGGNFVSNHLISSGLKGLDTPVGEFSIQNKHPRAWSRTYSLFMPNWMAITPDGKYGIHELPEWPGGYKEGKSHLGKKASHGCVRLGEGVAKTVYDWSVIGTTVVIYEKKRS